MRQALSFIVIALIAGFVGALFTKAPDIVQRLSDRFGSKPDEVAGFWSTPAIAGYGKIHYEPQVAYKPSVDDSNKIVFQVNRSDNNMKDANLGLQRVARVVNLYVASGVPAEKLQFVVSVSGEGTPAMLDNRHYREAYGVDNPNLKLISELRAQGVDVAVCDQAVAFHHYQQDWIDKSVTHALSNLTTVSTLQNQGYALLQM